MDNTESNFLKRIKVDVSSSPLGCQDPMRKKNNNGGTSAKQGMPDISDSINDR